jgi:hypothetical protein
VARKAVEPDLGGHPGDEVRRQGEVPLYDPVDVELVADRKVRAHVAEQRSGRAGEIAPVEGDPADGGLAGVQQFLVARRILAFLFEDPRHQLTVDRAAEAIHLYPLSRQ